MLNVLEARVPRWAPGQTLASLGPRSPEYHTLNFGKNYPIRSISQRSRREIAAMQDRDGALLVLNRRTRRFFPFINCILADAGYQGPRTAAAITKTGT